MTPLSTLLFTEKKPASIPMRSARFVCVPFSSGLISVLHGRFLWAYRSLQKKLLADLAVFLLVLAHPLLAEKAGSDDRVRRPLLGVVHVQAPRGVRIEKVLPDSAAERAGLKPGDAILSVNSVAISEPRQLFNEIQRYGAGTVVALAYERAGKTHILQVLLGERREAAALVGQRAPRIVLPQLGKEAPYTASADKVLVIEFWATWCAACEPVRRALDDFRRTRSNRAIEIVGITGEDEGAVKAFFSKRRITYPILLDSKDAVSLAYGVTGYPTVIVIDKKGIVRFAGFASGDRLAEALELAQRLGD